MKKSRKSIAIVILMLICIFAMAIGFAACDDSSSAGLSAYELYLQEYAEENNGSTEGALSQEDWLKSLQGENGEDFWESNPQGLAFYPQDDGTFAVGVGQAKLLSNIEVPAQYRGANVTAVIDSGFADCQNIKSVKLPETVKTIGDNAFANCPALNSVTLGDSVFSSDNTFTFNGETSSVSNVSLNGVEYGENVFLNTFMKVYIENSSDNDTLVNVKIENIGGGSSSLKIHAALNSTTDIGVADASISLEDKTSYQGSIDLGTYGLFKDIDLTLYAGASVSGQIENASGVGVSADEYNFAHLNGSYPVLVYTLKLKDITQNGTIPTFVSLERAAQYNWNALTYNMQMMPFSTVYDASQSTAFHHLRAGIAEYIAELYALNPDSEFNLYIVDNYGELILQYLVANNIPESNYTVTMLSDGIGTAGILSTTFAGDDTNTGYTQAVTKYNEMAANWEEIKAHFWESRTFSASELAELIKYPNYINSPEYMLLDRYAYILAKEESNISWWVNRLRPTENLSAVNEQFVGEIREQATEYNTNTLLSALSAEEQEDFKALYNFNDEMFSVAEEQGKDVIVILGSAWSAEQGNLYEYIRMTVELYGDDEYVYYYKGHPGFPTAQYPGRQEYFDKLAEEGYTIYELDNAIAAEIILFFNPEVYVAGYQSSTFDSLETSSEDKALAIFGQRLGSFSANYKSLFDVYVSVANEGVQTELEGQGIAFTEGHSYFLLEYNNTPNYAHQVANYNKHEIAIYDSTSNTFAYYKLSDGTYKQVNSDGTEISG